MNFEQQLSQKQKQLQKLAMTQQLQQSIQMLQYNAEEIYAYLSKKALENPLMEVQVTMEERTNVPTRQTHQREQQNISGLQQIPDNDQSLFENLITQIHLNYRDTYLRTLVLFLASFIDENGYLTITLEEAGAQTSATPIQLLDALTLLQQLDPAGVGARDLRECLLLQIERDNQAPDLAYIIVEEEFEHFVQRKWSLIVKKFDISLKEMQTVADYIQILSPSPGNIFQNNASLYIYPELTVTEKEGMLHLILNKRGQSQVVFQRQYYEEMQTIADEETRQYLHEKQKEVTWLQKTLQQREATILRVGREIMQRQQAFFLEATHPLKPMTLKEIAEALALHESTVSRAVNGKYLETAFGVFELRSFFTWGYTQVTSQGEEMSNTEVKKYLQQVIAEENKKKPFSDQKLVEQLALKGIRISRRTVTKYREALGIQSSAKRKRYE